MTEPVRDPGLARRSARLGAGVVALALAATLPVPVHAAPSQPEQAPELADADGIPDVPDLPDPSRLRAALRDGDLTTARELAVACSEAAPTPENYQLEAEVWTALGDYAQAERALGAALDALADDASAREQIEIIEAQLDELRAASRGTKPDEPASSHREAIDRARADRLAALAPTVAPPPQVVDAPKPVSIAKKWYFWVTLGAIVGTAGAIAGIAISAAVDDRNATNTGTASGVARQPIPAGGIMLRF
jgi:hypothetical protein